MNKATGEGNAPPRKRKQLWIFGVWLALFYSVWLMIVVRGDLWQTVADHWEIALSMAFGSYVAGSTPAGGGSVGFPILVLLFNEPASLGRDFSFAVQSIGMVSASIFIIANRQHLEWVVLRWALIGAVIGTPLGILFISPLVPDLLIKVVFAVIWASFGVLHLRRINDICANEGETAAAHAFDRNAGFAVGLFGGGTVAATTGVGVDLILYAVMVLLMRADLKTAIPCSVIIMAATSLIGIGTKALFTGVQPGVYENWLAAAPVVAVGAPLGAFIVAKIGRRPTLIFVAFLCLAQFLWTMQQEQPVLGWLGIGVCVAAVIICNGLFEWLWQIGGRLDRRPRATVPAVVSQIPTEIS